MEPRSEYIKVRLAGGETMRVEATLLGGEEEVGFKLPDFNKVGEAIEGIGQTIVSAIEKVKPQKATVEFAVEIGLDSGQLTGMLVKGTGKSSIKVTLEWGEKKPAKSSDPPSLA